jgi:hypothetical protein
MKLSHYQTPRTLADCSFEVGHPEVNSREPMFETVGGYLLAIVIGVGLACLLVAWWSS